MTISLRHIKCPNHRHLLWKVTEGASHLHRLAALLSEHGNWGLGVHQDSLGMLRGAVRSAFGPGVIGVLTKEK
jgi:hypothetical protein